VLKYSCINLLNSISHLNPKHLIRRCRLLIKIPFSPMIKLKILLKQTDQFITSHLLNRFKSFKKANFTINKTTSFFKTNNKTIKFLQSQTKYKKILFKNEKTVFNLQSPLKLKVKQRSKILSKCKRDSNL